ncbi:MAG: ABC transporter permease, partial [Actinomycetota bacterium]|nr:ABC transporter permease [Actinomycetota bacterium]
MTLIATLLVASFVIYGSLYLAPGSPIATLTGGRTPPPDVTATLNARYHLNDPFLTRYSLWLKDVVSGNLGTSIPLQEDVTTLIQQRAG